MLFTIARIDRTTGLVVNIECADQEWIDAHADDPDFTFEPYTPQEPAVIGEAFAPEGG